MRTGLIRILTLLALALAGVLLWHAWTRVALPGCSAGNACNAVLASRWSAWLGIPTSALALPVYLTILITSLRLKPAQNTEPPDENEHPKNSAFPFAGFIFNTAILLAAGAALWFFFLQAFILRAFCGYCSAAHTCALLIALLAFFPRPLAPTRRRLAALPPLLASLGLTSLILPQIFFQPTPTTPAPLELPRFEGFSHLDPAASPTLGSPDAPVTVGVLYTFQCSHCRDLHRQLLAARDRYKNQLAFVMLPTSPPPKYAFPTPPTTDPNDAPPMLTLPRLTVAVWLADPAQFQAFDAFLFQDRTRPRPPRRPRLRQETRHPRSPRRLALQNPRLTTILDRNKTLYNRLAQTVPRLIRNGHVHPKPPSDQALFDLIESRPPSPHPPTQSPKIQD